MATIRRFQDLLAWQKARALSKYVFQLATRGSFSRDRKLREQICDAGESAMSNTAEGFERGGNIEFRQFLSIAKSSATEACSHLYAAFDRGYIRESELETGVALATETGNLIGGLMRYLASAPMKGRKFRSPPDARPLGTRKSEPGSSNP